MKIEIKEIDKLTKDYLNRLSNYIQDERFAFLMDEEKEDVISFAERSIDRWKNNKPNLGFKKGSKNEN